MVCLLNEKFVSFVIDNHFKCREVEVDLSSSKLVFQLARHRDENVSTFELFALVAQVDDNVCLLGNHVDPSFNLSNELSRVGQDDDLDFVNRCVDLHKRRYCKCACLSTTIDGLEQEVRVGLVHHFRYGDSLNNRRFGISELKKASLNLIGHLESFPSLTL